MINKTSTLQFITGETFEGHAFGADTVSVGEVVFNTAMTGYPESLTDPSYYGQILVCSYPLIGNYGVPTDEEKLALDSYFESHKIQVRGLVISYESIAYSHWNATQNLSNWLKKQGIPGIFGVDTRSIIQKIRNQGSVMASIGQQEIVIPNEIHNHVAHVSTKEVRIHNQGGQYKVALVDCGVKSNIIRNLISRDCEVHVLPFEQDFNDQGYDAIFLSNGPGNPEECTKTIAHLRRALNEGKQPIYGICLGSQLMALACGAKTYKLKFGHRGHNQPVMNIENKKCYISSQNHGYAVDQESLPAEWVMNYINLNDQSCEGVKHKTKPYLAVQFHPEAFGGPTDTEFIFDDFIQAIKEFKT